jgi:chromosomal replication initiator protein
MATTDTFWLSCIQHFESELSAQQFNTWIKPLQLRLSITNDELILVAPNRFVLQWVKDNFLARIEQIAKSHFSRTIGFQLELDEKAVASTETVGQKEEMVATPVLKTTKSSSVARRLSTEINKSRLNPFFTFKNFVNGKANQLARAGAIQVAERPGSAYNPLFIYGGVGLGKTHLIQAIGNYVLSENGQAKVRYIHAEKYVSDVVRAYQHKAFDEFKRYYHSLDLLLIDDIQFFGGKNRTQEEFFYAFNALTESHKQVIITCDSYPKEISGVEERLISRFGWGLTVAVEPPELEMRVAILIKKH